MAVPSTPGAPAPAAAGIVFRTEFAVAMTCGSCVASVEKALAGETGIDSYDVSLADQRVVVEGRGACARICLER